MPPMYQGMPFDVTLIIPEADRQEASESPTATFVSGGWALDVPLEFVDIARGNAVYQGGFGALPEDILALQLAEIVDGNGRLIWSR